MVAIAFAREGADVAISYLPEEETDARHIVEQIEDAGRKAAAYPGDLKGKPYCSNVFALFWIVKAAVPHLKPGSTIIATASLEAYHQLPFLLDYAATKRAINNFTNALAQQLAPTGIRLNAVAPGPTWTALQVTQGYHQRSFANTGKTSAWLLRTARGNRASIRVFSFQVNQASLSERRST